MNMLRFRRRFTAVLGGLIVLSLLVIPVSADNWWGNNHWARTSNPFTLAVGDNVSGAWDTYLPQATADWSVSDVLDMNIVSPGGVTNAKFLKKCPPTAGRVEVCNARLGGGYLGIAQLWTNGDHITQATVKVNDSYYSKPPYNTAAEMRSVLCEELGHTIGLDHPEPGTTGGCVMGYAGDQPIVSPSAHDYEMIEEHYLHPDSETTVGTTTAVAARDETEINPGKWGRVIERDERGRPSVYGKELAPGQQVITFVVYPDKAEGAPVADGGGTGDGGRNDGGRNDGGKQDGGKRDGGKRSR